MVGHTYTQSRPLYSDFSTADMAKKDAAIRVAAAMAQKARMLCRTAQHAPLVDPLPQAVIDSVSQPPQAAVQVTSLELESKEAARSASSEQWRREISAALTLQPGLPVPLIAGGAASVGWQTDGSSLQQLRGSTDSRYQLKTVTLHMRSLGDFRSHLQMTPTALADACATLSCSHHVWVFRFSEFRVPVS